MQTSFALLPFCFFLFSSLYQPSKNQGYFLLLNNSQIFIEGSSNVNTFTCKCEQSFGKKPFRYSLTAPTQFSFQNTRLFVDAQSLDCGHKGMNRDMYKTLKTDQHPQIEISLHRLSNTAKGKLPVTASLTIGGIKRTFQMDVRVEKEGIDQYRIRSVQELSFQSFQLKPPSPMMGLIKVNDHLTLHFDLHIRLLPA